MPVIDSKEAVQLILSGNAPAGMTTGVLDLGLTGAKPPRMAVQLGLIKPTPAARPAESKSALTLSAGLRCYSLKLAGRPITSLPPDLQVEYKLDLTDCHQLTELPPNLSVSMLVLTNCSRLTRLPEGLIASFLQLDGCTALREWPESAEVTNGWVRARGCSALERLPAKLGPLAWLDLRGCRRINSLPAAAEIRSWVDIGGTGITSLPESLTGIGLRWKGVPVTAQIAFFPETLRGPDILAERNTEVRRVMIERVGFEKFLNEVNAHVLDTDHDRGGERKLLSVPLTGDETMVVVSVLCPSTGRQYLIRVPPTTSTCRQAVAWTAGFDNPDDYRPVEET